MCLRSKPRTASGGGTTSHEHEGNCTEGRRATIGSACEGKPPRATQLRARAEEKGRGRGERAQPPPPLGAGRGRAPTPENHSAERSESERSERAGEPTTERMSEGEGEGARPTTEGAGGRQGQRARRARTCTIGQRAMINESTHKPPPE